MLIKQAKNRLFKGQKIYALIDNGDRELVFRIDKHCCTTESGDWYIKQIRHFSI